MRKNSFSGIPFDPCHPWSTIITSPAGSPSGTWHHRSCIPDTIEAQTEQVLSNLRSLAKAAGSDLDHTVKVTVYLRSIDDFQRMNEVYRNFFKDVPPARGAVEVSRIPKDALVAMEAIFEVLS